MTEQSGTLPPAIILAVVPGFRETLLRRDVVELAPITCAIPVGLLELPAHLWTRWRGFREAFSHLPVEQEAYASFVAAVLGFLRFKRVRLPEKCRCDAIAIPAGSQALTLCRLRSASDDTRPATAKFPIIVVNLAERKATVILRSCEREASGSRAGGEPVLLELASREGVLMEYHEQLSAEFAADALHPGEVLLIVPE